MKISLPLPLPQPLPRLAPSPVLASPLLRWTAEVGHDVRTVAWLPDHSAVLVLTGAGHLVRLGAADGRPTWREAECGGGILCCSVCPTAPIVATGHLDGYLRLRNAHTGKIMSQQHLGTAWVEHVCWSPNGRWLAAAGGRALHLLDAVGRPLSSYGGAEQCVGHLSWRPDSGALAVGSGATVRLLEVPGGAGGAIGPSHIFTPGQGPLLALAWNPTGREVAARLPNGRLVSWQLPNGTTAERVLPGRPGPVRALSWHGSGRWLATAHGPDLSLWEQTATGLHNQPKRLPHHALPVRQLAFQHRGPMLASADAGGTLALWNLPHQAAPVGHYALGSPVTALDWMANDCCLVAGTAGGRVALLSVSG